MATSKCFMRQLIKRPWGFLVAYFGLWLIFGIIYSWFPNDFFCTTIRFENPFKDEVGRICEELSKAIASDSERFAQSQNPTTHNLDQIKNVQIHSLRNSGLEVRFCMDVLYLIDSSLNSREQKKENHAKFDVLLDIQLSYIDKDIIDGMEYARLSIGVIDWTSSGLESAIFPYPIPDDIHLTGRFAGHCMRIPQNLFNRIQTYYQTSQGFPTTFTRGSFGRMIYFSAVTILTIGYGDIVPITDRARILIMIEGIGGILLIGLFLNSLIGNKNTQSKKDSEPSEKLNTPKPSEVESGIDRGHAVE